MTTIVQLGEEDLALEFSRVLQSIGGTSGGKNEESKGQYEKLVVDGKYSELLDNGVFRQSDKILSSETETVDLVLCLCLAVLERITSPAQYASAVKSLIKLTEVSSATSNHSVIKIRFLVNLFNRLYARARQMEAAAAAARSTAPAVISETLALAYETLSAVFRSALVTNNAQCVVKQLKHLQSWLAGAGSIAATPSSELWILAHQIAKASVNATTTPIAALHSNLLNESDGYLLQYLKSLQNTSADKLNAALPHAQAAALRAIHSPLLPLAAGSATQATASPLEASRLLSLNAIKHLSNGSEQNKLVYKLLSIFASPNGLTEYDGLYKSHGSIIKELSLDHDANLKKLRIIALCRLALQHDKLTYADIAGVLKVDVSRSDLIESAVIEAIQSGRLDAKLDQESDCVLVKRVTGVHFWLANDGEWTALSNKLGAWKNNVVQVVNTLALNPHQASFQEDAAEDI